MSRYQRVKDGEWMYWRRAGHQIACCDCGLVHLMKPRVRKGRVEVQAFRLPRQTAGRRRRKDLTHHAK